MCLCMNVCICIYPCIYAEIKHLFNKKGKKQAGRVVVDVRLRRWVVVSEIVRGRAVHKLCIHQNKIQIGFLQAEPRVKPPPPKKNVYDKRLDFNFKVNSLTNWYSCISKKSSKKYLIFATC